MRLLWVLCRKSPSPKRHVPLPRAGDTVEAKSAHDDLFTLWKNADAEIPRIEEARAESARLP
jgi:hypothetical protein